MTRPFTIKATPTNNEHLLKKDDLIVTKTNLKGEITYANKTFLDICVFHESDILNQPHNIIRHPDMPKAIFRMLWNDLKRGDEFFGVVKNLCNDGGFYWVFANITPSFDATGKVIGYFSVRRHVSKKLVNVMVDLYSQMVREEKRHSDAKKAIVESTKILTNFLDKQGVSLNEYILSFT